MKILKNYLYSASYQLFIIIVPIITVPYISRTLGPESVGVNAYTNSIMSYFVLFGNLGLSLYGNRTIAYFRNNREKMNNSFWEIFLLKISMMIISFLIFLVYMSFFGDYRILLFAQSVQLLAMGLDISWFFVGIEEFKKTVGRNLFVKIISLILIFSLVKKPNDLIIYILINAGSVLIGNLTLWTYMRKYIHRTRFSDLVFKLHFKPVIALFIPQLATTVFMTISRILLGELSNMVQIGFFDSSDKIVRIFLSFITALGTVLFPRIANAYKEGNAEEVSTLLSAAFNLVSFISFPIAFGLCAISKVFSQIFFGNNFVGIDIVLGILIFELIFMGWSSIIGQQFMVAINNTRGLNMSMLVSTIILVSGSVVLIPKYGAVGAAIMSVISEFIIILVQFYYVRNKVNLNELFSDVPKYFISSLVMFSVVYSLGVLDWIDDSITGATIRIIAAVLVYFLFIFLLKPTIIFRLLIKLKESRKNL